MVCAPHLRRELDAVVWRHACNVPNILRDKGGIRRDLSPNSMSARVVVKKIIKRTGGEPDADERTGHSNKVEDEDRLE